jgi:hypothetical protein
MQLQLESNLRHALFSIVFPPLYLHLQPFNDASLHFLSQQ